MSPYKDPKVRAKKQKIYRKKFYEKNKEKVKQEVVERKLEIKEWYYDIKKKYKCSKCGEDRYYVLLFHHLYPKLKFKNVSRMVHEGYSRKRILAEIDKCTCWCTNCHTAWHFKHGNGNKE